MNIESQFKNIKMKKEFLEKLSEENIVKILDEFYSIQEKKIETSEEKTTEIKKEKLAKYIDHTLLKPDATIEDVKKLCYEAKEFGFYSACINPSFVSLCREELKNTNVKVCTVIGFPLGATTTEAKQFETEDAVNKGAGEVDMVLNIGKMKYCDYEFIYKDINSVVQAAKQGKALTKVILETCLLSDAEKVKACLIAKEAGADFVKTSTGFSKSGATESDISLMRFVVGEKMGVKASGGVRTYDDAIKMINAGASRIGASSSVNIVLGINEKSKGY